jgi:Tol biopolymer transport system component
VYNLYQKPTSGAKDEELLLKSDGNKTPTSWSHDGQFLLYTDFDVPKRKSDVWLLPLNGNRKPAALFATQSSEADGQFSPDGHFVAYLSDESGRFEVYVAEISGTSTAGKWLASQNGADNPRWRGDGKALFYSAPDGTVMEVEVSATPTFQAFTPKPLFKLPTGSNGFDMTGDGNRFLVSVPVEQDAKTPFTVMLNWQTDFKK